MCSYPIKEFTEMLGGKLTYEPDGKKGMILVETEFTEALMQVGKNMAVINGHKVNMGARMKGENVHSINGKAYVRDDIMEVIFGLSPEFFLDQSRRLVVNPELEASIVINGKKGLSKLYPKDRTLYISIDNLIRELGGTVEESRFENNIILPNGKKVVLSLDETYITVDGKRIDLEGYNPIKRKYFPIRVDMTTKEDGYQLLVPFDIVKEHFGLELKTMARAVIAGKEPSKEMLRDLTEESILRRIATDNETRRFMQNTSHLYEKVGTKFEEDGKKLVEILVDKYEFMSCDRAMAYYHREGMFNPDLADMKVGIYDNTITINMSCFSEREQERLKFILSKIMTSEEASKTYNAVNDFVVGESHFIKDKLIKVGAKSIQFYHNINEGTLTMHIKDPNMRINLN